MREVSYSVKTWEMKAPFKITDYIFTEGQFLYVKITENGVSGCGEAAGIYYCGESGESMLAQLDSVKETLERERVVKKCANCFPREAPVTPSTAPFGTCKQSVKARASGN